MGKKSLASGGADLDFVKIYLDLLGYPVLVDTRTENLTNLDLFVLGLIMNSVEQNQQYATLSGRQLALMSGMCKRSVNYSLRRLREARLIKVGRFFDNEAGCTNLSNTFSIPTWPPEAYGYAAMTARKRVMDDPGNENEADKGFADTLELALIGRQPPLPPARPPVTPSTNS